MAREAVPRRRTRIACCVSGVRFDTEVISFVIGFKAAHKAHRVHHHLPGCKGSTLVCMRTGLVSCMVRYQRRGEHITNKPRNDPEQYAPRYPEDQRKRRNRRHTGHSNHLPRPLVTVTVDQRRAYRQESGHCLQPGDPGYAVWALVKQDLFDVVQTAVNNECGRGVFFGTTGADG